MSVAEDGDLVRVAIDGRVALVTLDRPAAANAINPAMALALRAAVQRVETDDAVRVAIIASSRPSHFCAGADLKVLGDEAPRMFLDDSGFAGFVRVPRRKPWIAAVDGIAVAGGFEIVLACDLVVASPAARFGVPEVRHGLVALAGGVQRLPRRLPRNIALELLLTAGTIGGERAFQLGLVNRLASSAELMEEALALARLIAANAPEAVRASLDLVRNSVDPDDADIWAAAEAAGRRIADGDEVKEGLAAFAQKRKPRWAVD